MIVPGQFCTFRGHLIQVTNPKPEHIDILDIARALSGEGRYCNHVMKRISVAEHCCHIHDLVPTELRLQGLMHDATEAYLRDIPKPVKVLPEMAGYVQLEDRLWVHVAKRFGLPVQLDPLIKRVDVAIRDLERRVVHGTILPTPVVEGVDFKSLEDRLFGWGWDQERAESEFLCRFQQLLGDAWVTYTHRS